MQLAKLKSRAPHLERPPPKAASPLILHRCAPVYLGTPPLGVCFLKEDLHTGPAQPGSARGWANPGPARLGHVGVVPNVGKVLGGHETEASLVSGPGFLQTSP